MEEIWNGFLAVGERKEGGGAEKILLLFLPLSNIGRTRIGLLSKFPKTHHQVSKTFFVPYEICFIVPLTKKLPVKLNSTIIAGDIFSKTPKFISRHCKGKRGDLPRQGRARRGGEERRRKGKLLNSSLEGGRQGRIWKHVLPPPNKFDSLLSFQRRGRRHRHSRLT